jgi:hypothetical protein
MSGGLRIAHYVAIAGCVREKPSALPAEVVRDIELRLGGVLIEIVAGPPAFEALRAAQLAALAAGAVLRRPRWDRTYSQADGIYFFTNLPPGDYGLRVSAPGQGTRFGSVASVQPVQVGVQPGAGGRWAAAPFDVLLPSTRLRGVLRRAGSEAPVMLATVRVLGEAAAVRSDEDGNFELRRLPAGRVVIDISAAGLAPVQQAITVRAGEEVVIGDIYMSK